MKNHNLTFKELREANVNRLLSTPKFKNCLNWSSAQWLQALVGEVGELANFMKKVDRGDLTLEEARTELAKELADIQTYLDLLAAQLGVGLGQATVEKFNEVSRRVGSDVFIAAQLGVGLGQATGEQNGSD